MTSSSRFRICRVEMIGVIAFTYLGVPKVAFTRKFLRKTEIQEMCIFVKKPVEFQQKLPVNGK